MPQREIAEGLPEVLEQLQKWTSHLQRRCGYLGGLCSNQHEPQNQLRSQSAPKLLHVLYMCVLRDLRMFSRAKNIQRIWRQMKETKRSIFIVVYFVLAWHLEQSVGLRGWIDIVNVLHA
ncbi:unnamed protein product [Cuscuta epithymum]|uniref:Uncharacterized protein n=1 Tax=Cuscuta epithymum TaxID=186058 RepID=A0AAV0ETM2_9ASTE|nr:unnamed protein product [Cuscuta epithymum]